MKPVSSKPHPRRTIRPFKAPKSSSPVPIIIACAGVFLFALFIIIGANSGKNPPQTVTQNTPVYVEPTKEENKPTTNKSNKKTDTNSKKETASQSTGESQFKSYQEDASEKGIKDKTESTVETVVKNEVVKEEKAPAETTEVKKESGEAPSADVKEQSIQNLKLIYQAINEYANDTKGRLPIMLNQIPVDDSNLTSPWTNQPYVLEANVKAVEIKQLGEVIIVREAKVMNGKYLCLYGNGKVEEVDPSAVE